MTAGRRQSDLVLTGAMRAVLDAVSDGVVVMDRRRRLVFANRAAATMLGHTGRTLEGRPCHTVLNTTDCEHNCPLTRLETRGEPALGAIEMTYCGAGGRSFQALSHFEILFDDDGAVVGAVETFRDLTETRRLEEQLFGRRGLGRLVGKSCAMRRVYELIEAAARSDLPVMVTGENGTGKELVARAIHELGSIGSGSFVAINCAALSERTVERELFGALSTEPRQTLAETPPRRTIYLKEVDRLSSPHQQSLLEIVTDAASLVRRARIVASTPRDIDSAVDRGAFDRDLFYRLNSLPIHVPPLRDRAEDIPLLVEHFVRHVNQRFRSRFVEGLAPDAVDVLCAHDFPGNVRELEHAIEHAFTRCRGKQIRLDHLPPSVAGRVAAGAVEEPADASDSVELLERDFMLRVLEENGWRLNAVATQLGLSRTTLWRKLRRLAIEKPKRS